MKKTQNKKILTLENDNKKFLFFFNDNLWHTFKIKIKRSLFEKQYKKTVKF